MSDGENFLEMTEEQSEMLRQEYGWFYMSCVEILASYDPLVLVASGAPDDEYDVEVDAILLRMGEATSLDILSDIVYEEFSRSFNLSADYPKTVYTTIAARVWETYQRWLREQKNQ